VRTPVTPLLLSSTSNIEKLPFGKPNNQYGRHSYNRHSTVICRPTVIVRSLVLGHCIVRLMNVLGHLYDRWPHWLKVEWLMNVLGQLYSRWPHCLKVEWQPPWYVHSSSNHYNMFTSHSTFNQCGHLSYNHHNTFIGQLYDWLPHWLQVEWLMNVL
jgi:hypothetical protein